MNLYRLSLMPSDVFSPFFARKLAPLYIASETKESALEMANRHLKTGLSVKSISLLGVALSDRMFSGNKP